MPHEAPHDLLRRRGRSRDSSKRRRRERLGAAGPAGRPAGCVDGARRRRWSAGDHRSAGSGRQSPASWRQLRRGSAATRRRRRLTLAAVGGPPIVERRRRSAVRGASDPYVNRDRRPRRRLPARRIASGIARTRSAARSDRGGVGGLVDRRAAMRRSGRLGPRRGRSLAPRHLAEGRPGDRSPRCGSPAQPRIRRPGASGVAASAAASSAIGREARARGSFASRPTRRPAPARAPGDGCRCGAAGAPSRCWRAIAAYDRRRRARGRRASRRGRCPASTRRPRVPARRRVACSGAMYSGVPTTRRGSWPRALRLSPAAAIHAKPKSSSFTFSRPSAACTRKTFSGFTSRWITPACVRRGERRPRRHAIRTARSAATARRVARACRRDRDPRAAPWRRTGASSAPRGDLAHLEHVRVPHARGGHGLALEARHDRRRSRGAPARRTLMRATRAAVGDAHLGEVDVTDAAAAEELHDAVAARRAPCPSRRLSASDAGHHEQRSLPGRVSAIRAPGSRGSARRSRAARRARDADRRRRADAWP